MASHERRRIIIAMLLLLLCAGAILVYLSGRQRARVPSLPEATGAGARPSQGVELASIQDTTRVALDATENTNANSRPSQALPEPIPGSMEARLELEEFLVSPITELDETYLREMLVFATGWGRKSDGQNSARFDLMGEHVNPEQVPLTKGQQDLIRQVLAPIDEALDQQGRTAFELLKRARREYYDRKHYIVVRETEPGPGELAAKDGSLYNAGCKITQNGWTGYMRFQSADYPYLNDHLIEIVTIRAERSRILKEYIDSFKSH